MGTYQKSHAVLAVALVLGGLVLPLIASAPVTAATNEPATNQPADYTYDFEIPQDGDTYAVGTPATINGTLADVFPTERPGYAVYALNGGDWAQVTDFDSRTLHSMDAVAVTTVNNSSAAPLSVTIPVDADREVPPTRDLREGWNLVAAPQYSTADTVFSVDSAVVAVDVLAHPQATDDAPSIAQFGVHYFYSEDYDVVSPFSGYYLYVQDSGEGLPGVVAQPENRTVLNDQLNIDESALEDA